MRLSFTFILLAFGICSKIAAQEPLLSKEEAVALALENNYGIQMARNQVEIAANNKKCG